jgi:hypothetical protein
MADESAGVAGVATLFDGFELVFARWQAVERPQDLARTFVPLFEVLEWTACIDERLETNKKNPWLAHHRVWGQTHSSHTDGIGVSLRAPSAGRPQPRRGSV